MLREAIARRGLLAELVKRDLRGRYVGSVLGLAWHALAPILMITIYAVIFSQIVRGKLPALAQYGALSYVLYLVSALLPWLTFQEVVHRSTRIFLEHSNLLRKVHFPEQVLSLQVVLAGMVNLVVSLAIFTVFTLFVRGPTPWLLLLPVLMALQMVFMTGISLFVATMNIFLRDIGPVVTILLMVWFWMTPIVYPLSIVPAAFQFIVKLNPTYYMVETFRSVLAYGRAPVAWHLAAFAGWAATSYLFGVLVFERLKYDIADVV